MEGGESASKNILSLHSSSSKTESFSPMNRTDTCALISSNRRRWAKAERREAVDRTSADGPNETMKAERGRTNEERRWEEEDRNADEDEEAIETASSSSFSYRT